MTKNRYGLDMLCHTDIAMNFGVLNSKHEIRNSKQILMTQTQNQKFKYLKFEFCICSPREIGVTLLWEKKKENNQS